MILAETIVNVELFERGSTPDRESALFVLAAFAITFAFIRTSARLMRSPKVPWWPGSVTTESGLHIHHMVWGIWLMLISGFLGFAIGVTTPWVHVFAVAFGIGAGLTLDEFALWLHLDDVYWSEDGRSSVDAAILAGVLALLVVLGLRPFGLNEAGSVVGTAAVLAVNLSTAAITFFKGRIFLGALAVFVPVVGIAFALRLAKPGSPWAHRFYAKKHPDKMAKSRARFASDKRSAVLGRKLQDAIGGTPTAELKPSAAAADPDEPKPPAPATDSDEPQPASTPAGRDG